MDAYQAGQQLGTLLLGSRGSARDPDGTPSLASAVFGSAPEGSVYYKTLQQGAQAQNAMQVARANRSEALIKEAMLASRQQLPAAISGVYTNPAQAALASAVLGSNSTVSLKDLDQLENPNAVQALGDAASAMRAGDFPAYNQNTALAAGKPFEPVRVADGIMMPSGVGLGDASFQAVGKPAAGQVIENGPIPQTAPTGLPAETVAYVPKVFNFLDGAPPFGADGQPTAQLLDAVRRVESNGNPNAVSPAGAQGPYQFMPATAASVGVANPFDEAQARAGAAKYLGQLYQQFGGDARKAVAAYNAGPGTVAKLGDATIAAPAQPQTGLHMTVLPGAPEVKSKSDVIAQRAQQVQELKARGVAFTPDQEQAYLTSGKAPSTMIGGDNSGGMSTDATYYAAWNYNLTGQMPPFGMGGSSARVAVYNEAAKIARDAGVSPQQMRTVQGRQKALTASLTNVQKQSDVMERQMIAMHNNINVAEGIIKQIDNGNFKSMNALRNAVKLQMGDEGVAKLNTALNAVATDYGKVMSGATGAQGASDTELIQARKLMDPTMAPSQLRGVFEVLAKDTEGQVSAAHAKEAAIGDLMGQFGTGGTATPGVSQPGTTPGQTAAPSGIDAIVSKYPLPGAQ